MKSLYQKDMLVAVFIFVKDALFLFMRTDNMHASEIINMIHEYAQAGSSLNLSPKAVQSLSSFLYFDIRNVCPSCYEKLKIENVKGGVFQITSPIFRLTCKCGWAGDPHTLPPAGSP